jgi:3-oxoacyl-[acyl-carrier-protein] synthase III
VEAFRTMTRVAVLATGSYLPGAPLDNDALERLAGPLPPDVLSGIQVERRHWIVDPETGEHLESNCGMAARAVANALASANVDAGDVDLLVVSTASPEYLLPPMATFLQERMGLERCATIEVRSGCAGAVEALDIARLYIEAGVHRTAVVVGSEAISPLLVPVFRGRDPESIRMRDRLPLYTFGDGAGAIVLGATANGRGLLGGRIASVGGGRKPGMQIVGAGTHEPIHRQLRARRLVDLRVDVAESARVTPHVLTEALPAVLEATGERADAIHTCVIPEGNAGYLTDELREAGLITPEWLAVAPRIYENLATVGATGSAAVPLALDDAWRSGRLEPGARVLLLAIETSKWKYAGAVLDWTASAPLSR